MKKSKLLKKILASQQNVRFGELKILVESFGFRLDRISGSHHIFVHRNLNELANLQEVGGQVKPYQVK